MWGRYVQHSVQEAVKNIKTDKQRQAKASSVMRGLLSDPTSNGGAPPKGAFRDPAAMIQKG